MCGFAYAQLLPKQDSITLKPISPDCAGAIQITLGKKTVYGLTVPPNGFGKVKEIHASEKKSVYFFDKEHNTAWYYFDVVYEGELVFEIVPQNPADDYDFLLFKSNGGNFSDTLKKKKILPIRTNISRSVKDLGGRTGLTDTSKDEFVPAGLGNPFSKSIHVKKGEHYYLVLDNVYKGGSGHTINFNYVRSVELSGIVLNEQKKPLKAEVVLSDDNGNDIKKTVSDSITGKYDLKVKLLESVPYVLTFNNDSCFIASQTINTDDFAKKGYKLLDIKVILPLLRGGRKYTLNAINFYGDTSVLLPQSYGSVRALSRLMKRNNKMIIRIEGHVNNPKNAYGKEQQNKSVELMRHLSQDTSKVFMQKLSDDRAEAIKLFLLDKGIEKERISTIGFSDKKMLFPNAVTEEDQMKNRRVEINVISVK